MPKAAKEPACITMEAIEARRRWRAEPKFNPTEIRLSESGGCARQQLLRVTGAAETHPRPAESEHLMETGDIWERQVIEALISHLGDESVHTQVHLITPYGSHGHIDAEIALPDGTRRLVECKATKAGSRKYLPNERNVRQMQAYLHFYGHGHGITTGELVYVLRETGEIVTFVLDYDPAMGASINQEQEELARLKATNEVPPAATKMNAAKFPCYYSTRDYEVHCPYWGHCWGAARMGGAKQTALGF